MRQRCCELLFVLYIDRDPTCPGTWLPLVTGDSLAPQKSELQKLLEGSCGGYSIDQLQLRNSHPLFHTSLSLPPSIFTSSFLHPTTWTLRLGSRSRISLFSSSSFYLDPHIHPKTQPWLPRTVPTPSPPRTLLRPLASLSLRARARLRRLRRVIPRTPRWLRMTMTTTMRRTAKR
ncbi:hypothetical protein GQ53DRAFT_261912 [Thozetella sp. PMI_491]|nr:hypothetical protein GQ53DRAFT_261912 [Thozetella sp. PMI_491]